MTDPVLQRDSPAWLFFVKISFALSVAALAAGIFYLPVDVWARGYLAMGTLFTIGSSITLSKTVRDDHEAQRLLRKIEDAQTSAILQKHVTTDLDSL